MSVAAQYRFHELHIRKIYTFQNCGPLKTADPAAAASIAPLDRSLSASDRKKEEIESKRTYDYTYWQYVLTAE